ncbi:MAG: hypothetical protein RLZZ294_656 [Bacteroidota bacterium]|jgi:hypothetical protein
MITNNCEMSLKKAPQFAGLSVAYQPKYAFSALL